VYVIIKGLNGHIIHSLVAYVQGDTKKWEHLKNPTKIEEIQEKKNY